MKNYYVVFMVMYQVGDVGETNQDITHARFKGRRPNLLDIRNHIEERYNKVVGWQFINFIEFADDYEYVRFFGVDAGQHKEVILTDSIKEEFEKDDPEAKVVE